MDVTRAVTTAVQLSATVSTVPLKATAHIARGAVNVSEVKPRLGVQFVDAKTDTTYVVPVTDLSYILMDVEAYVDVRGLNPIFRDMTPVIDLNSFLIGKGVIDPVTISEGMSFEWGRALNDEAFTDEQISILIEILRTFEDALSVADASTIGLGLAKNEVVLTPELFNLVYDKGLVENILLLEAAAKGVSKVSQDAQSASDSSSVGIGKSEQETVTATQSFQTITDFQRVVEELISQNDITSTFLDKSVEEFVASVDAAGNEYSKIIDDAFFASESAFIQLILLRSVSDDAYSNDDSNLLVDKGAADEVAAMDSFDRILDIGLQLADVQFTVDEFSRIHNSFRTFEDDVLVTPAYGPLNEITLNTILVGGVLGGDYARPEGSTSGALSDGFGVSDGGSWSIQDYGQPDYFAQDYVGIGGSI